MKTLNTTSLEGRTPNDVKDPVLKINHAAEPKLISGNFKMSRMLENLHCHFLFCSPISTLSNFIKGPATNDFQDLVFLSCTAQNIFIPHEKQI